MPDSKKKLRKHLLQQMGSLTQSQLQTAQCDWEIHFKKLLDLNPAWLNLPWVLYSPFDRELDVAKVAESSSSSLKLAYVQIESDGQMCARIPESPTDFEIFKIGSREIKQPKSSCPILSETIPQLLFVPGLAFDKKGFRLGRGKGFYDRFIAKRPLSIKVGVAIQAQIVDSIAVDSWDQKMDFIVTDQGYLESFHD